MAGDLLPGDSLRIGDLLSSILLLLGRSSSFLGSGGFSCCSLAKRSSIWRSLALVSTGFAAPKIEAAGTGAGAAGRDGLVEVCGSDCSNGFVLGCKLSFGRILGSALSVVGSALLNPPFLSSLSILLAP